MNFTVFIPGELMVGHENPLESYALSEARTQPMSTESRNEDDQFGQGMRITENLLFAGLLEGRWTGENNFDLNGRRERERQDTEGSVRARLIYRPTDSFIGVAELRYQGQDRSDDEDGDFYEDETGLGETDPAGGGRRGGRRRRRAVRLAPVPRRAAREPGEEGDLETAEFFEK